MYGVANRGSYKYYLRSHGFSGLIWLCMLRKYKNDQTIRLHFLNI